LLELLNVHVALTHAQGAILAVGGAQQAVRLEGGKPVAHSYMTVTLSADHRMYDGELLSSFLAAFRRHMESPVNLLV
jgi:pyruvate dehydrogenase E2 component (dihydrolipoamide acetyltransferase)